MRSHIVLSALVLTLLLTAAANVVARGPGSQATAQQALPDCVVKMHRKYDYSGRLYIQKVRVCRTAGGA
ncbi:MAG: hypothetical protein BGO05_09420 [Rhizobiales bacterium 63-7]|uniref:hypothetical protein n=1 Tax=Rhizobium TaxID=379 RepID=UPI000925885C|nr:MULTISPECIES: hypothetical protein [Rhizobium]MBN9029312.1 hypothetical protein [Hyphomicrobiales bacterium]MDG3577448.1 hypothetical protein [Rhizobium sp. YJ-22]OJU71405.1 MAG: hypothetical protein BGO05_09420 [Rhizobiales bacterium 63-7]